MSKQTVIALAALAAAGTAHAAQDHPSILPTRDVMVEYHMSGKQAPQRMDSMKIYYTAQGQRMRIEVPGQPGYSIVDRAARRMTMVMVDEHMYMELPFDPQKVMNFDPQGASFTRHGSDTVAGFRCTVYDVKGPEHRGQVCVTDDGLMLRGKSLDPQRENSIEATKVSYGPQQASLFTPPADFQKMDTSHLPQMRGRGRPPG